jgi:gag-polypeptide of LTR copia-type
LTTKSLLKKEAKSNVVNVILNLVSEGVSLLFDNMTIVNEIWNALKNQYESNFQIKRTKITGPKTKFKNFRLDDGETIENMYNRLIYIRKEIYELGETLFNEKVIKNYCVCCIENQCGKDM